MIGVIEHSERHKKTYKGILSECAIREKAKKDIVGAHYEKFRESFIITWSRSFFN